MSAQTILEFQDLFTKAINSGDIDAILELYEDDATLVSHAGGPVSGKPAIRAEMLAFLQIQPRFRIESSTSLQAGNLALLETKWLIDGSGPTGFPMRLTGKAREVVRRGPDGYWRYVIDDPGIS